MKSTPDPPPNQTPLDALASPRAAADLTGLDYAQVRDLIQRGAIRVRRIGKGEYLSLAELERVAARGGGA